jgi:branched-chain amino acid transport system ATP-binding protein
LEASMTEPLLSVSDLRVAYGKAEVVHGVSLAVQRGQVVTVIGANGAGKTTILNSIMGVLRSAGSTMFDGQLLQSMATERRVGMGLSLVPERRELFADMTVEDNLLVGGFLRPRRELQRGLDETFSRFPRLKERRHQIAGTLSGGERQMLALGRALMGKPKLLMLDEPSLGLAPRIVKDVFHILTDLKNSEISILLIEQNARVALQIADYAYVIEVGVVKKAGSSADISRDARLVDSYLGFATPLP